MMMMFYLLTPLLVRLADFPRLYLLVSCAFVVGVIFVHKQLHPLDTRLIQYLPCFLFGVAYKRMVRLEPFFKSLALWWWLLLIPAFYLYQLQQGAGDIAALGRIPLVLLGTLLLFYAATPLAKHSPTTLLLRISYASFCLYLFHRVIFQWSIDLYFPNNGYMRLVYLLGLVLPAMVVISYYLQWAYDRGIQKLRL